VQRASILKNVFSAPVTDPNYMPVTRDLSEAKRNMLLKWLDHPVYMNLNSKTELLQALQQAVELEHATIPPYLTALYSIKPGCNVRAAALIRSVVVEEMLHMALVCNLMVSLGGTPAIGRPGFTPNYPGSLPGGLRPGLTVRLRKCSIAQIRDVFMGIEQPDVVTETDRDRASDRDPLQTSSYTIGWFYDQIAESLKRLSASGEIQFGHTDRQVSDWTGPGTLVVVDSLEKALSALNEIKEQGEGASPLNPYDEDAELAHYYKFSEIVEGREIVVKPGGFAYTGPEIPFEPEGVYPMVDDPNLGLLPKGSRARLLSEQFAKSYQAMLNALHITFNGKPDHLRESIGLMYSLSVQARELMATPSGREDGTTAGPVFQLPTP